MTDPARILREYAASDHAETIGATVVSRRALNEAADAIDGLRMRNAEAERWLRACLGQVEGTGLPNWDGIRDFLKESN